MKIELIIKDDAIKIFINDIIHICINQSEFLSFQSWIAKDKWCIGFYMKGNHFICEYDSLIKWKKILSLLSKNNLFNNNF